MKTNSISIVLIKKNKKRWGELNWKEDKFDKKD